MHILIYIYIVALTLFATTLSIYWLSLTWTRAPFIPLSSKHMQDIVDCLGIGPGSVFMDLGSGDGRVVLACAQAQPQATCVGVEFALAPTLMSRLAYVRAGKPANVVFRHDDIFLVDVSKATHIFCYLFPEVMADVHEKFKKELAPGTKVVVCDFPIVSKEPLKVQSFKNKAVLGKKLYVYQY